MQVRITRRFIDEKGGRLYGPSVVDTDEETAFRLIDQGRAIPYTELEETFQEDISEEVFLEENFPEDQDLVVEENSFVDDSSDAVEFTTDVVDLEPPKTSLLKAAANSDIPAGFPERHKLITSGITSIADLQADDIEERLSNIQGFGQVTVHKIGVAISELKS